MRLLTLLLAFCGLIWFAPARAQEPGPEPGLAAILAEHGDAIAAGSRRGIGPALEALAESGLPEARTFLDRWLAREVWRRKADGLFFHASETAEGLVLTDAATLAEAGTAPKAEFDQLRPGGGIRALISAALVQFQLADPDPGQRAAALASISRDPDESHLQALRDTIADEDDAALKAQKERLERLLTIRFDADEAARIAAIEGFAGDIGVDVRAVLNPLVATTRTVAEGPVPDGANVAQALQVGTDISREEAIALLVAAGALAPVPTAAEVRAALEANVEGGFVGGVAVAQLSDPAARVRAYAALAAEDRVPDAPSDETVAAALSAHSFFDAYRDPSPAITTAAQDALDAIATKVGVMQAADLTLDALSLASIYFLAAIGLAITFGVMGVINMAHGEFIMMGAYTGYVVQLFVPDYTLSILIALPLAFVVTAGAGVAMERLVIRWLYHRPLETLLATFGISIALQQLAKNIFGTQARPLTSPDWLGGSVGFNEIVSISTIRVAIFVLALIFLVLLLFILKRTRLGLEVRAVTQNPRMAASMGIDPDRINMLTFGLGSGIAGIAGVAIGLFAQVTSEIGQQYIVQSFMTVVVGGVGNIWGTLAGATLIGFLQKGIEWFNPSNTLAAQTYMILFIILFIQFRPKGIIALRGRAAGD